MSVAERRQREKEARRARILEAAERVFHSRGPELTTMEDVADEAQLGKGTLYLYFKTKEDLLLAIAAKHQQTMLALFEREAKAHERGLDAMRAVLLAYMERMSSPVEHLRMVMSRWVAGVPFGDGRVTDQMRQNVQRLFGAMCDTIARGQRDGSIRDDQPSSRLAVKLWSGVNGALLMQLKLACFPQLDTLQDHAPDLQEQLEFVLDAARPVEAARRPRPRHADARASEVPQ